MAFRADEAAQAGFESALNYLTPRGSGTNERLQVKNLLQEIVCECGPVVAGYPAWHPFMMEGDPSKWSMLTPQNLKSFIGLDHTVYFQNGILTCPYGDSDDVLIKQLKNFRHKDVQITTDKVENVKLYNIGTKPVLIKCIWYADWKEYDGTFNVKTALGLMLEREIPNWRISDFSESWDSMCSQIIGEPHGARSSLFVNQVTGQQLKSVWNQIIKSGLFGLPKS